jgi:hypothetical protein
MENRHGLLVDFAVSEANGTAERDAVPTLIDQARQRGVTPHVAQNTSGRRSAIDGRTTCRVGYDTSQRMQSVDRRRSRESAQRRPDRGHSEGASVGPLRRPRAGELASARSWPLRALACRLCPR